MPLFKNLMVMMILTESSSDDSGDTSYQSGSPISTFQVLFEIHMEDTEESLIEKCVFRNTISIFRVNNIGSKMR